VGFLFNLLTQEPPAFFCFIQNLSKEGLIVATNPFLTFTYKQGTCVHSCRPSIGEDSSWPWKPFETYGDCQEGF
jgi:hypothetical protein